MWKNLNSPQIVSIRLYQVILARRNSCDVSGIINVNVDQISRIRCDWIVIIIIIIRRWNVRQIAIFGSCIVTHVDGYRSMCWCRNTHSTARRLVCVSLRHCYRLLVGRRCFAAAKERLPQLKMCVGMIVWILHRHRSHIAYVAANVANAANASLIVLVILVILVTHLTLSLTKSIDDDEENRQRDGGGDASHGKSYSYVRRWWAS